MSIRLRLALIYSLVLCLLGALAVGAIYLALAHAIDSSPIYSRSVPVATPDGIDGAARDVQDRRAAP